MLGRTHTTVTPERPGGLVRHLVYLAGDPRTTPVGALYQGPAALPRDVSRLDRVLAGLARRHRVRVALKFVAPIGGAKRTTPMSPRSTTTHRFVSSRSRSGVVRGDLAALIDVSVEIADVDAAEAPDRDREQRPRVHEVLDMTLGDVQSAGDLLSGEQQARRGRCDIHCSSVEA